jgi:hypothetical protein
MSGKKTIPGRASRLFGFAPPGTTGRTLQPPDPDGGPTIVPGALPGDKYVAPGTAFDPPVIAYVREFIETMMRDGTDRYGKVSVLCRPFWI